jgi:gluconolactonase
MSSLDVRNPGLHDLISPDAPIERVAGGLGFTEGPVWRGTSLLFSDIPNRRIVRWRRLPEGPELTTYATGHSNGLTLDRQGWVLAAEHGGRRVSRVADDGTRTALAEQFQGKRLNSPNDIVVKSDGSVYFTDPPYAVQPSTPGMPRPAGWWTAPIPGKELPCNGVYRITPDGTLHLLVDDFALPNGLAFSPDESVLYVDDSAHKHIRAFDVRPDGALSNSRILLDLASEDPGVPDGLKVDLHGNVFCTGPGGVWVCRPSGELLGRIILPELPANLAWGEDGSVLFLTARTSVYRLQTTTRGALPGS